MHVLSGSQDDIEPAEIITNENQNDFQGLAMRSTVRNKKSIILAVQRHNDDKLNNK